MGSEKFYVVSDKILPEIFKKVLNVKENLKLWIKFLLHEIITQLKLFFYYLFSLS